MGMEMSLGAKWVMYSIRKKLMPGAAAMLRYLRTRGSRGL